MTTLVRHIIDDETVKYIVDGVEIFNTTHDNMGWSGMEIVESGMTQLANMMNWKIETRYYDD